MVQLKVVSLMEMNKEKLHILFVSYESTKYEYIYYALWCVHLMIVVIVQLSDRQDSLARPSKRVWFQAGWSCRVFNHLSPNLSDVFSFHTHVLDYMTFERFSNFCLLWCFWLKSDQELTKCSVANCPLLL